MEDGMLESWNVVKLECCAKASLWAMSFKLRKFVIARYEAVLKQWHHQPTIGEG